MKLNKTRRGIVAVTFAILMVASMATMPLMGGFGGIADSNDNINAHTGTAVAEEDDGICGGTSGWILSGASGLGAAYCVVSDWLDDPDEAEGPDEMEEGAYAQAGDIDQTWEEARTAYDEDRFEDIEYQAFADGEQVIVENRYEGVGESQTESEAITAVREAYDEVFYTYVGDTESTYRGAHNEIWSTTFNWAQSTHADEDAESIYDINLASTSYHGGSATLYRGQMDVYIDITEDTEMVTSTMQSPSGEEMEYVAGFEDVEMTEDSPSYADSWSSTGDTDNTERTDIVFNVDPDQSYENEQYGMLYHYESGDADFLSEPDSVNDEETGSDESHSMYIHADDPNSDDSESTQLESSDYSITQWLDEFESGEQSAINGVQDRTVEYFDQVDEGEQPADEYYGPREFVENHGASMGTDYAADMYMEMMLGIDVTDPAQQMEVEYDDETYSGGLVLGDADNAPQLHDDDPVDLSDGDGAVTLGDDYQHEGEYTTQDGTLIIEFEDNSGFDTSDIGVDVINADDVSVDADDDEITAEAEGLQHEEFVLFETYVESENEDGETETETSDTYVKFGGETNIETVSGFVVGEEYDVSADMIHQAGEGETDRINLDDTWTLESAYTDDGDEADVVMVTQSVDTEYTGVGIEDRIGMQQAIQDAFDQVDMGGDDSTDWWLYVLIVVFGIVIVGLVILVFVLAISHATSVV